MKTSKKEKFVTSALLATYIVALFVWDDWLGVYHTDSYYDAMVFMNMLVKEYGSENVRLISNN